MRVMKQALMLATLYALVVLQSTSLTFSHGYTTAAECLQQYMGPNVACFSYDSGLSTWTAFFKLPEGGFRTVGKISSEDECKRYIGAFKDGIPTACRQLAMPVTCNVACVAPPPPPAAKPVQPGSEACAVLLGRSFACNGEGPTRTLSNEWGGAGGSKLSI